AALSEKLALPAARVGGTSVLQRSAPDTEWRVLEFNGETGEMTAIGSAGKNYVIVKIKSQTPNGGISHPRSAAVLPIQKGVPVQEPLLPGSTRPPSAVEEPVSTGFKTADAATGAIEAPFTTKQLPQSMFVAE